MTAVVAYRTSAPLRIDPPDPAWNLIPDHCPAAESMPEVNTTGAPSDPTALRVPLTVKDPLSFTVTPGWASTLTPDEIITELPV
jgi:hypothetical protein